jgi:RecA/RadA recombinase
MTMDEKQLVRLKPRSLDDTLGRVILPNHISVIHSSERKPLTTVAHTLVAGCLIGGGQSVFIDSGNNYSPRLMRGLLGKEEDLIKNVIVGQVLELSDLQELSHGISCMRDVRVVVVDSLTGVLNLSGKVGTKGRQRALFHTLEVLRALVNDNGFHVAMTDHSSPDWSSGALRPVGGNVLAHGVDTTVHVASMDVATDGIKIQVERSPVHPLPMPVIVKLGVRGARTLRSR